MSSYTKCEQELLSEFGAALKKRRLERGLSQEKLAELCGLHRTYVSSTERGERNVSLINLNRIAKALGVEVSRLI